MGRSVEKGRENRDLGRRSVEVRARESEDQRVSCSVCGTLLTTVVLGSSRVQRKLARGGGGTGLEELLSPSGYVGGGSAIGNNRDVGLGVGRIGIVGDGVFVDVGLNRSGGGKLARGTKSMVESHGVGSVESEGCRVRGYQLLLVSECLLDFLVVLVGYVGKTSALIRLLLNVRVFNSQVYLVWVTTSPRSSVK